VEPVHPILGCAADVSAAVKSVAGVEPAFMSTPDKEAALVALTAARSQLEALTMRVLAAADDVAEAHGAARSADWLAAETRTTRCTARAELELGQALERHPQVATELSSGHLRSDQAKAIVQAVEALPDRVTDEIRAEARSVLLDLAARHDARDLKQLGKRILDVIAPEVGESHEAAVLAAEEARADATVVLTLVDDGEGRCHGRFTAPSRVGKMFRRHLLALANPARHPESDLKDDTGRWKSMGRRLGEAFVEYVERYPVDRAPLTAGVNPTLVVTMTLEQLLAEHATAVLDDGSRMSAGQARRLACEAGIIPAVLDTRSQPLDLGRTARLFTKPQRIALGLRDGGCTARGCETSASGCHAHHDDPWSLRGLTDLAKGRLLCPRHHRLAHDARYAMTIHADNTVTFTRRT
jgi:hypothetical protein